MNDPVIAADERYDRLLAWGKAQEKRAAAAEERAERLRDALVDIAVWTPAGNQDVSRLVGLTCQDCLGTGERLVIG